MRLTICRGCCCGTKKARPDVDHAAQLARLSELTDEHGLAWRQSECLGPCEEANVVVVHPSPQARAAGARPVWFGLVDSTQLEILSSWLTAGGPGMAPLPDQLVAHIVDRPARAAP
ncbi:(2Fe-2S) ferredoxin domain-containing protein [uncultured Friedmanniella sp.]|uniref:(2Fe-2S) ferredoxin domain-containing protein n=1 Tax=uncultured Friedmanniella sp. TaxID=335381 RepID=UPI0035CB7690